MSAAVLHIPRLATAEHVADLLGLHPRTVQSDAARCRAALTPGRDLP